MREYPLAIYNDRALEDDYSGRIHIWDIDKTYLSTRFSSLKGLAKIPVEFAIDKRAIPGMPEVLRGLRQGAGPKVACVPLYFISASPPFLHSVLEEKMLMDGVEQDGIIFKDWLATLLELKPGRLWEQLGFKLIALLTSRVNHPLATEYLFGDDMEMDPLAFSTYAKILSGELKGGELESILHEGGVPGEDRDYIRHLMEQLGDIPGKVEKIFIHLERGIDPHEIQAMHPDVIPVKGAYQLALVLRDLKLIPASTLPAVRRAISAVKKYRYGNFSALEQDARSRGLIKKQKRQTKKVNKKSTARRVKKNK